MRPFFDHSRHVLRVWDNDLHLDVLAFRGEEGLSELFRYAIEFTCTAHDIDAEQLLGKQASFSLFARPEPSPLRGFEMHEAKPLRTLYGVLTGFKRLSGSRDEARYEVTLEPRFALLGRGQQFCVYQQQSVPQIVESILRDRHGFRGQDFFLNVLREYPQREQVMQYGESDLAFICRLLAEVGIWFRFISDDRLRIDRVEFHDDQSRYTFGLELPCRTPSGLGSGDSDAVWDLQSNHQVVEREVAVRSYVYTDAAAQMDAEIDLSHGAKSTHGHAYLFNEPYREIGDRYATGADVPTETGAFFARLRHEQYLNNQVRLSGVSAHAGVMAGHVLNVAGGAPHAFSAGAVITRLTLNAARDSSLQVHFQAIPYSPVYCFRPPLLAKPSIAGTVPARITAKTANDPYGHIDLLGRYKVRFLFDRASWATGTESLWLRLARPYAGHTYGLHMPLLAGAEVAIAFEHGDPDRPYIAHALHDSQHPDLVTRRNHKRNVLRTPSNNKLRLDDTRGEEHIKLSTEHSGKSQLNLGHLVDGEKAKRGEGAELRTDGHAAIRAGAGVFISADKQAGAQGQMLDMRTAMDHLQQAGEQMQLLSDDAQTSTAEPADVQAQLGLMRDQLDQLKAAVALISAPQGIALVSGEHLQLAARRNVMINAGNQADVSVAKRLFIGVGHGLSLFVRKLGIKLIANQGPVTVQAQNDKLELLARQGLSITSSEDEIQITAKKKIVLNGGGSYIRLDQHSIESGTTGDFLVKAARLSKSSPARQNAAQTTLPPLAEPHTESADNVDISG